MASNPTPDNLDVALALAEDMADGLDTHEASVGVKQNTAAAMRAAISAARTAESAYSGAKSTTAAAEAAVAEADEACGTWIKSVTKVLAISLGARWSMAWEATGFPDHSTGVPRSQDKRLTLLASLKDYFTANPGREAASLEVTAAKAQEHFTALSQARDTAGQKMTEQKAAKNVRDSALEALRLRIRGLITELGQLLGADDPRWDAFGLSSPSAPDVPEPASGVELSPGAAGSVLVFWKRGRRATRYRLFGRLLPDEPQPYQMALAHDLSHTLTGLPSLATLEVQIIAANETAEAAPTPPVTITVP